MNSHLDHNKEAETQAICQVLEGAHPGNFFVPPYMLLGQWYSEKDELEWIAALPAGWSRFRQLLHLWFFYRRNLNNTTNV